VTDTTISFTGESSLTGCIVQTWAAATEILLGEKVHISSIRLIFKVHERLLVSEAGCKKFQICNEPLQHTANNKLEGVQKSKVTLEYWDFNCQTFILQICIVGFLSMTVINWESCMKLPR